MQVEEKKGDFLTSVLNSYKYCTGEDKISFPLITKELKENLGGIPKQTVLDFLTENKIKLKKTIDKKIERDGYFKSAYFAMRYLSSVIKREIEKGWAANPTSMVEEITKNAGDVNIYELGGSTYKRVGRRPLCELMKDLEGIDD